MAKLTEQEVRQFGRDGYLLIENLFDPEEMDLLLRIAKADEQVVEQTQERRDLSSGRSKLWITSALGEDFYSAFVRC